MDDIHTELKLDPTDINKLENSIQFWEADKAISQLHTSTSAIKTDIPPEFIKNLGHQGRFFIYKWTLQMWEKGEFPKENDILHTTFLHKKGRTDTLDNYRTLTIGCNIFKIYNRILTNRIQDAAENLLEEIQNGFRPSRRATDNLLVLETVIRKSKREHKKKLPSFIGYYEGL